MILSGRIKTCIVKMVNRRKRNLVMNVLLELREEFPDKEFNYEEAIETGT